MLHPCVHAVNRQRVWSSCSQGSVSQRLTLIFLQNERRAVEEVTARKDGQNSIREWWARGWWCSPSLPAPCRMLWGKPLFFYLGPSDTLTKSLGARRNSNWIHGGIWLDNPLYKGAHKILHRFVQQRVKAEASTNDKSCKALEG